MLRNQQLLKLKRSDALKAKKPVPSQKKQKDRFAVFCDWFRKGLNVLFTFAEALVLISVYAVVLKYCFYAVFEYDDYVKIYGLIEFLKKNYVGAILLFLLVFSRTCFNMLYSIRLFKVKDYEVQRDQQKQMWDII